MVFERHALVGARKRLCFSFGRSLNSYSDQQFSFEQLNFDKTLNFKLDLFSFVFYLSTPLLCKKVKHSFLIVMCSAHGRTMFVTKIPHFCKKREIFLHESHKNEYFCICLSVCHIFSSPYTMMFEICETSITPQNLPT